MSTTRREFLALQTVPIVGAYFHNDTLPLLAKSLDRVRARTPADLASDEDFWIQIQNAFSVDRSLINFNNGGCCPAPTVVVEAQKRHIDFSNHLPTRQMWHVLGPELETVRERVARAFGVSPDEIAITRNASESLEIVQFGLDLKPGDEVITTTHDYPNMVNSWNQRVKRDGIVFKQVAYQPPATHDQIFDAIAAAVSAKTRVIHTSHITFTTGQIGPVRRICEFARERGIECIVDGAHAFGQFAFTHKDLNCDYYGVSLHKWILAPVGVGFLYVRKSKIPAIWPLFGNADPGSGDIRKFETYGTHPFAAKLAVSEALTFHQTIGPERKEARLRFLRESWVAPLRGRKSVVFYTSDDSATSAAIGTVGFRDASGEMLDPGKICDHLMAQHRIVSTPISSPGVKGIRITPNVYTTKEEIEILSESLVAIAEGGIPTAAPAVPPTAAPAGPDRPKK
ncbi:MAG: aminotransferase class V-fold PLP-dependent enzyme [Planctomycetes bacterium]|nr:aminotransferase class V-fold PLP-dependent enzyme [Planctomycetota bacterium]